MKSTNAVQLLRNDLKVIKGLFAQAKSSEARAPEMSAGVLSELCMLLEVLGHVETKMLNPTLQGLPEASQALSHSAEEQTEIQEIIQRIRQSGERSEDDESLLQELFEVASLHMKILETEILPLTDELPQPQLEKLGKKIGRYQERLLNSSRYENSHPNTVQNPNGGEQKRKQIAA